MYCKIRVSPGMTEIMTRTVLPWAPGLRRVLKPDVIFVGENVPRDRVAECFALTETGLSGAPPGWESPSRSLTSAR